jgi:hypothetical protein
MSGELGPDLTNEQYCRAVSELVESQPDRTLEEDVILSAVHQLEDYAVDHAIFELWRTGEICLGWSPDDGLLLQSAKHLREKESK